MFSSLGEGRLRARVQRFALGAGILDAACPTEEFVAQERRSLSEIAALAERARVDLGMRIEVVSFIRARMTMRDGGGSELRSIPALAMPFRRICLTFEQSKQPSDWRRLVT